MLGSLPLADWIVHHLMQVEGLAFLERFGVSKHVLALWSVVALLLLTFVPFGRRVAQGPVPRGLFVNLLEAVLLFIRDQVSRPFLGKEGDRFLPVLWTIFFYILYCNLFGLLPLPIPTPTVGDDGQVAWHFFGTVTATGQIAVTGTLAVIAACWYHGHGLKEQGLVAYVKNICPSGVPAPLIPAIFLIEVVGMIMKPLALAIRLWANMTGGHTVLYVVLGMIFIFEWAAVVPSVALAIAVYFLEIFVAFLQAYVFTFLVTVFLGAAVHPDH